MGTIVGCEDQPKPDPIGLDSGSTGGCKVDWNNASLAPKIGHVAGNTYWTQDGRWSFGCGNATSNDHRSGADDQPYMYARIFLLLTSGCYFPRLKKLCLSGWLPAPAPSRFTMPELQAAGQAKGSVVRKAGGLSVAQLEAKVRTLLELDDIY